MCATQSFYSRSCSPSHSSYQQLSRTYVGGHFVSLKTHLNTETTIPTASRWSSVLLHSWQSSVYSGSLGLKRGNTIGRLKRCDIFHMLQLPDWSAKRWGCAKNTFTTFICQSAAATSADQIHVASYQHIQPYGISAFS